MIEGIGNARFFLQSKSLAPGARVMHKPHPRSASIIAAPHLGSIPTVQEQASSGGRELDAQQRSYRDAATAGRVATGSAAAPELNRGTHAHVSGRPGRTSPAVTSTSRLETWPAASLGRRDSGRHGGVVGAEPSGGMKSSTPSFAGHFPEFLAHPRIGGHAAADPQPLHARACQCLARLGHDHVDHGFLEAGGQVADQFEGSGRSPRRGNSGREARRAPPF